MRLVLDTNVIVAAMRSPAGASAALLRLVRQDKIVMLANVALAIEYEAVCSRSEHIKGSGLNRRDVDIFVTAVIAMCEPVETYFLWRPQLHDPSDEFVLEAAVNGRAAAIVTFNTRDFADAPQTFGIGLYTPAQLFKSPLFSEIML
jgi:putative PIN family toxin of toxin-antitoxin system